MSATYFTTTERREALAKWMRRNPGMKSVHELYMNAADIFTPLYGSSESTVRTDLQALIKNGAVQVHKRRGAADQFEAIT